MKKFLHILLEGPNDEARVGGDSGRSYLLVHGCTQQMDCNERLLRVCRDPKRDGRHLRGREEEAVYRKSDPVTGRDDFEGS